MPPPRKTIPIDGHRLEIQITDDESRTLLDPSSGVAFHSASGAAAETKHVYLINSGVADRLSRHQATSVLEIGLGTGLGMLLTLEAAVDADAPLRYTALEHEWLDESVLTRLEMDKLVADPSIVQRFLKWRQSIGPSVPRGEYRWQAGPEQAIDVQHGDALQWLPSSSTRYDAIYFDPFAPEANPRLWQPDFLARMFDLLDQQGRLVTYCVNRTVREAFASVGFEVSRVPGPPGGKREVMIATKSETD